MLRDLRQSAVLDLSVTRKNLAGGTVYDASKKKNNGTLNGGVTVVPGGFGVLGQAWKYGASSEYFSLLDSASLNITGPITIYAVVSTSDNIDTIFGAYKNSSPFDGYGFGLGHAGTIGQISFWNGVAWSGAGPAVNSGTTIGIGITLSSGNVLTCYKNDTSVGTVTAVALPNSYSGTRRIGLATDGTGQFAGTLYFLAIWAAALSPAQVSSLYNALRTGQPTSIGSPLTRPTRRAAIRRRRLAGAAAAPTGGMPWFIGGGMGSFIGCW